MPDKDSGMIHTQVISSRILLIRGERVMLDADLAALYGVETKRLNEQVRRNKERFPADFMFQLNSEERKEVVAICDHLSRIKFSSTLPYAFTEHGAIMAASVLNTPRAVETSVYVVRAFVKLRELLTTNKGLSVKLAELERKLEGHDTSIRQLVGAIRGLMQSPEPKKKRPIGFGREEG